METPSTELSRHEIRDAVAIVMFGNQDLPNWLARKILASSLPGVLSEMAEESANELVSNVARSLLGLPDQRM